MIVKKLLSLSFGTALYQILAFISYPFFAIYYDIEVFSQFGQYSAILSVVSVWSVGRFNQAILVDKNNYDRYCSLLVGAFILTVTSVLSSAFVYFYTPSGYLCFIPISILAFGIYEIASSLQISKNKYSTVSVVFLIYGSVTLLLQFFFIERMDYGLVVGKIIGDSILLLISLYFVFHFLYLERKTSTVNIIILYKHFLIRKDFLLFGCPQGFLSSFSRNLPMLVLPFFSVPIAGYYALFYKLIAVPVDFLSKPIRQIVLNTNATIPILKKYYYLSLMIYPVVAVTLLMAYYFDSLIGITIFSFLKEYIWIDYIFIAFALCVALVQILLTTPIKTLMINYGLQKNYLFYEVVSSFVKVISIYLFLNFVDTYLAISLYIVFVALVDNCVVQLIKNKLFQKVSNA